MAASLKLRGRRAGGDLPYECLDDETSKGVKKPRRAIQRESYHLWIIRSNRRERTKTAPLHPYRNLFSVSVTLIADVVSDVRTVGQLE